MSSHSRKDHLETIRGALTTAAKSVGYLVRDIARHPSPRAAGKAVHTKTADIAAQPERAGHNYSLLVKTFISVWTSHGHRVEGGVYGLQSPALVAEFIKWQSGIQLRPFHALDLATQPGMSRLYDWLPPHAPPRVGDIAVYGPGPNTSPYGTCGIVAEIGNPGEYPRIFTQGIFPPRIMGLGRAGILGYWRYRG